ATDTYDAAGAPVGTAYDGPMPPRRSIDETLDSFRGTFLQRPPRFSAKKIDGQRSYRIARASGDVRPAAARVTVHAIEVTSYDSDRLALSVLCSSGFYVRSLAHDLGERLGTGVHLIELRRTRSGDATLADAIPLAILETDPRRAMEAVVPLSKMLP